MKENREKKPLTYQLVLQGPLIDKFLPGGHLISKVSSRPLRPFVDFILLHKPTSSPSNRAPNAEVFRGYEDNWFNFGIRTVTQILDRPKKVKKVDDSSFSPTRRQEMESGITKIRTRVKGRKVTAFISPPGFVPYSFRTMDIFPNRDGQVPVSATLREVAKKIRKDQEFPAIAMTAASWNRMVIIGDVVYVKSLDDSPVEQHVKRHIQETAIGIDTRSGAQYFTFDDFFNTFYHPPIPVGEANRTTQTNWLPGLDAHWLVTKTDGNMEVMSATQIRAADAQQGFRDTIASITSTAAFVNEKIAAEYSNRTDLPVQLINAIVLFTANGEKRIGSVHGTIDTNAVTIYNVAKHLIEDQFPDAEDIAVGVIDGGGSTGAIVRKREGGTKKRRRLFDGSTLPLWMIQHEIPIYTGLVPQEYVTNK